MPQDETINNQSLHHIDRFCSRDLTKMKTLNYFEADKLSVGHFSLALYKIFKLTLVDRYIYNELYDGVQK